MSYFRNVIVESAKEGVAKRIIVVGKDPEVQSKFVVFSFDPKTKAERILGQVAAQVDCSITQLQGKHFQVNSSEYSQ